MPHPGEPTSAAAVAEWIAVQTGRRDRFAHLYRASERHRNGHGPGCTVYPTSSGALLGVLAAATGAGRILELGCGLGYSAAWLAYGSAPAGVVETIEKDQAHAALARTHLQQEGYSQRVLIHEGSGSEVLPRLRGPYDLIFADGDPTEYLADYDHFLRLLRASGLLASSNLFLGQHVPDLPGLEKAAAYRERLLTDARLLTAFAPGGLAVSVRTG